MTISAHSPTYPVRAVPLSRPFVWIARGWDDLMHHRTASLAYGLIVSSMGMIIIAYQRHPLYLAAAVSLFLLVGPVISAGVCELSRCRDINEETSFNHSLDALRPNHDNLINVANYMLLIGIAWFACTFFIMQSMLGSAAPQLDQTLWGDGFRHLSQAQVMAYGISWVGLSGVIFALSCVAVPMIIDHHSDAKSAMKTSLQVTIKDFPAMMVWAAIIVSLVAFAFATYLVAMVVIFPLLGHATWFAYRDLVKQ